VLVLLWGNILYKRKSIDLCIVTIVKKIQIK